MNHGGWNSISTLLRPPPPPGHLTVLILKPFWDNSRHYNMVNIRIFRVKKFSKSEMRMQGRKKDAPNTFFIYGYIGFELTVKDHSHREIVNRLPPHGLLFPVSSKGLFICIIPYVRITHTTAFATPVVEYWRAGVNNK